MSIETALKASKASQGAGTGTGTGAGTGAWGASGEAPTRSKRGVPSSSLSKEKAASSSSTGELKEIDCYECW